MAVALLKVVQGFTVGPAFAELADPSTAPTPGELASAMGTSLAFAALSVFLTLAVLFFGLGVTWDLLEGQRTSLGDVWSRYGDRFPAYVGLAIVVALAVLGVVLLGFLLFFLIIPPFLGLIAAVYLTLRWYVAPAALVFEGQGVTDSMSRSSGLTDGEKLSILGIVLILFLVNAAVSFAVGLVATPGTGFGPTDPSQAVEAATDPVYIVGSAVATYLAQLVSVPLGSAAIVHAFRDLRGPREAAAPGAGAAGGPGAAQPETFGEPRDQGPAGSGAGDTGSGEGGGSWGRE